MYELSASDGDIHLWSDVRLPFEPKGEALQMRNELRDAVRALRGPTLFAAFEGAGGTFDLENVLFYNVGCSAFSGCGTERVRFERRFVVSTAPGRLPKPWHHWYSTLSTAPAWVSNGRRTQLELSGAGKPPGSAAAYWLAAHSVRTPGDAWIDGPLTLELHFSSSVALNLVDAAKKAIDGVLASLHQYAGSRSDDVSTRAASQLGIAAEEAARMLAMSGPLGPRQFVWPFGQNLQWSPADDRLVAIDLYQTHRELPGWGLTVELAEAAPA
jgi:hypothetical protein